MESGSGRGNLGTGEGKWIKAWANAATNAADGLCGRRLGERLQRRIALSGKKRRGPGVGLSHDGTSHDGR